MEQFEQLVLFERSLDEQEALLRNIAQIAFDKPLFDTEKQISLPDGLWDVSEEC